MKSVLFTLFKRHFTNKNGQRWKINYQFSIDNLRTLDH